MILPESAFISNFSMVTDGEEFVSKVEGKEKASDTYNTAVNDGREAGIVSQTTERGLNKFTVNTNLLAGKEILFKLTYEELLERKDDAYEHVIDINPGEIVDDLKVLVNINETLPVKNIEVPEILQSNEIDFLGDSKNEEAVVKTNLDGDSKKAQIEFKPDTTYQEEAGFQGVAGKFKVRYDVDRSGQDNEIQVVDGYFVHYFVPEDLETLPKHAIFILDISGSMLGERLSQLKDAMFVVLNEMGDADMFTIITFSDSVNQWKGGKVLAATKDNKREAIKFVIGLEARGGTDINQAIVDGLNISRNALEKEILAQDMTSMIVFLTDGEATLGVQDDASIKANIREQNKDLDTSIFCIGFGQGADFSLLRDISKESESFAKQVYEGSDAALQLEGFYTQISSPLITNLNITYLGATENQTDDKTGPKAFSNTSLTETAMKTLFRGGQFVVSGKLDKDYPGNDVIEVTVMGNVRGGDYEKKIFICPWVADSHSEESSAHSYFPDSCIHPQPVPPTRTKDQEFLQNLHAFLNIKQLLLKDDEESNTKALQLALDNNFVTSLTSLVVEKPDRRLYAVEDIPDLPPPLAYSGVSYALHSPVAKTSYNSYAYGFTTTRPPYKFTSTTTTRYPVFSGSSDNTADSLVSYVGRDYDYEAEEAYDYNFPFGSGGSTQFTSTTTTRYPATTTRYSTTTTRYPTTTTRYPATTTRYPTTTTTYPATTTTYPYGLGVSDKTDIHEDDYKSEEAFDENFSPIPPLLPEATSCAGNVTLFNSTYLRGEELVVSSEEMASLGDFEDMAVSLRVAGDCCWRLFRDEDFLGESKLVSTQQEYKGVLSLEPIALDVSSIKREYCF